MSKYSADPGVAECQKVAEALHEGYGVEDIQVKWYIPAHRSRAHIKRWRKAGMLGRLLKTGKL